MNVGKTVEARSRGEWRRWLVKHHKDEKEVWLIIYKKPLAKTGITYDDAVEEAVCYGWIDVQTKRMDQERYALRFNMCRSGSSSSESNKARAAKMLLAGKMTRAGRALLPIDMRQRGKTRQNLRVSEPTALNSRSSASDTSRVPRSCSPREPSGPFRIQSSRG